MMGERDLLRLSGRFDPGRVRAALTDVDQVEVTSVDEEQLMLGAEQASARLPAIFAALSSADAEVRETTLSQPSLESLFIKLTGRELRE